MMLYYSNMRIILAVTFYKFYPLLYVRAKPSLKCIQKLIIIREIIKKLKILVTVGSGKGSTKSLTLHPLLEVFHQNSDISPGQIVQNVVQVGVPVEVLPVVGGLLLVAGPGEGGVVDRVEGQAEGWDWNVEFGAGDPLPVRRVDSVGRDLVTDDFEHLGDERSVYVRVKL